jgi:hypothetical protein
MKESELIFALASANNALSLALKHREKCEYMSRCKDEFALSFNKALIGLLVSNSMHALKEIKPKSLAIQSQIEELHNIIDMCYEVSSEAGLTEEILVEFSDNDRGFLELH